MTNNARFPVLVRRYGKGWSAGEYWQTSFRMRPDAIHHHRRQHTGVTHVFPCYPWGLSVTQQDLGQFLRPLGHHLVARVYLHRFHVVEPFGDAQLGVRRNHLVLG